MADLKVNAGQWNELSSEDQAELVANLREIGLLGAEENIVPDETAEALTGKGLLECIREVAEDIAGCASTSGLGLALCVAKVVRKLIRCLRDQD